MAEKQALTARMPQDTYERVERYRERKDLSKSDASRRLVEAGLEAEEGDTQQSGVPDTVLLMLTALMGAVVGFGTLTHGFLGFVVLIIALALGAGVGKLVLVYGVGGLDDA